MADYYPLISKAVAGLDKNTGETRRALYERARQALVAQLRGVEPALSESDITRERLGLEEAIRKVEAEAARRLRAELPRADARNRLPTEPAMAPDVASAPSEPVAATEPVADAEPDKPAEPDQKAINLRSAVEQLRRPNRNRPPAVAPSAKSEPEPRFEPRPEPDADMRSGNAGVRGLRDVVADADTLGGATAKAARSVRESFAAMPSPDDDDGRQGRRREPRQEFRQEPRQDARQEPRQEPRQDLRQEPRIEPDSRPLQRRPRPPARPERDDEAERREPPRREPPSWRPVEPPPRPQPGRRRDTPAKKSGGFVRSLTNFVLLILIIIAFGVGSYWQRHNIVAGLGKLMTLARSSSTAPPPATDANAPTRGKITDRVGAAPSASGDSQAVAPVAQRVVLYEEDSADPNGRRSVGTAIWRTEPVTGTGTQPGEIGVRADIVIPDRNITVTWTLRRNLDKDLPASHTVSIIFNLPADYQHGAISDIRGMLMKQNESTRGQPLGGLAVKVTNGYFLIGLTATDTEIERNLKLLKEQPWFDIAIIFSDGKRAIMAVEKGTPGDRAFSDAFAAWGQ